jgi:hypothetical protein
LAATSRTDAWFRVAASHTYSFTVSALAVDGAETAVSAPLRVRVDRARASLSLAAKRRPGQGDPLHVDLTAVLRSARPGVPAGSRPLELHVFDGHRWRVAGRSATDAAGRATWSLSLGPGKYAVRARFDGGSDLLRAQSRSVSLTVG